MMQSQKRSNQSKAGGGAKSDTGTKSEVQASKHETVVRDSVDRLVKDRLTDERLDMLWNKMQRTINRRPD